MHLVARIDLVSLAPHLKDAHLHPALVKAIERAASAGSIREDLRCACESFNQFIRIQNAFDAEAASTPEWFNGSTISGALFVQANVLYARATETKGDRQPLLGEAKLTEERLATHNEVMN